MSKTHVDTPSGCIKVASTVVLRPPDIVADGLPKLRCGVIGETGTRRAPPVSVCFHAVCALYYSAYLAAGFGVAPGKGTGVLHGKSCRRNALVPVR
jgi:hypothetical protein